MVQQLYYDWEKGNMIEYGVFEKITDASGRERWDRRGDTVKDRGVAEFSLSIRRAEWPDRMYAIAERVVGDWCVGGV